MLIDVIIKFDYFFQCCFNSEIYNRRPIYHQKINRLKKSLQPMYERIQKPSFKNFGSSFGTRSNIHIVPTTGKKKL